MMYGLARALRASPARRAASGIAARSRSFTARTSYQQEVAKAYQNEPDISARHVLQAHRPGLSRLSDVRRDVEISAENGKGLIFEPLHLRDCCRCPKCVDVDTSQKLFETADIPLDIEVVDVVEEGNNVTVSWSNDIAGYENHVTQLSKSYLADLQRPVASLAAKPTSEPKVVAWDRAMITDPEVQKELTYSYDDYISSDLTLRSALQNLWRWGIIFIKDSPDEVSTVKNVATRIGPVRNSFYNETWDVRSVPSPKNVAYTAQNLNLHMDLLYMKNPPGLQFLHYKRASSQGGESVFSDVLHAVKGVQLSEPALMDTLYNFPVTYHYKNDNQWYHYSRPTIELEGQDPWMSPATPKTEEAITSLSHTLGLDAHFNWAPPFQGPFDTRLVPSAISAYARAAKTLKALLEHQTATLEIKMPQGTTCVFNNRRVVHGRKAFDGQTGERWLRGAYVDSDVFKSRTRVLSELDLPKGYTEEEAGRFKELVRGQKSFQEVQKAAESIIEETAGLRE